MLKVTLLFTLFHIIHIMLSNFNDLATLFSPVFLSVFVRYSKSFVLGSLGGLMVMVVNGCRYVEKASWRAAEAACAAI